MQKHPTPNKKRLPSNLEIYKYQLILECEWQQLQSQQLENVKIHANVHKLKIHPSIAESFNRSERTWTWGLLKSKQYANSPWMTWQSNPLLGLPSSLGRHRLYQNKTNSQIISHSHQSRRGEKLREGTYLLFTKSRGYLILQLHLAPIKRTKIAIAIPHCTKFIFSPSSSLSLFLDQDKNSVWMRPGSNWGASYLKSFVAKSSSFGQLTAPVLSRDLSKYIITIILGNYVRPPVLLAESKIKVLQCRRKAGERGRLGGRYYIPEALSEPSPRKWLGL